jgi:hypothetical protein
MAQDQRCHTVLAALLMVGLTTLACAPPGRPTRLCAQDCRAAGGEIPQPTQVEPAGVAHE